MAGSFVLSLDTELAWGTFDKEGFHLYRRHLEQTRSQIGRMLELFRQYHISATWAFVGHLFLDECHRETPGVDPHPDVLKPSYGWYPHDWHQHDPGTNRHTDPFWYGDDILQMVREADPRQEIGCHTFSHIVMADVAVNQRIARSQVAKCCELARERGFAMRSFVYPRNRIAHLPVLKDHGFVAYRGVEESWYRAFPSALQPALHFADRMLAVTPPTYRDLKADEHGLVNIPASMFLMPADGLRRVIPGSMRVLQGIRGLEQAARTGGVFHLWFHPWNLGSSPAMCDWLERILDHAANLREQERIRILTMGEVAAEVLGLDTSDLYSCY